MKSLALMLAFLVGTSLAQEVKHAPTVEQCRADQKLWLSKVEDPSASESSRVLDGWGTEMIECLTVDPTFENRYYNTAAEIHSEQLSRVVNFLSRHNLYTQFLHEDQAGKR